MPTTLNPDFAGAYLGSLSLTPKTITSYRQYVRWIERFGRGNLSSENLQDKVFVSRFVNALGKRYDSDHRKHVQGNYTFYEARKTVTKTILKHYLRFLQSPKDEVATAQNQLDAAGQFKVTSEQDGRKKALRSIALRRGQPQFRKRVLEAYEGRCAVTETAIEDVLEAAHIIPYNGASTNHLCNGILLRSDIHALFDLGLLSVEPENLSIYCSERIRHDAMYGELHGKTLRTPPQQHQKPHSKALQAHYEKRLR